MSAREWQPGDVALVSAPGLDEQVMTWATECYATSHPRDPHWHVAVRNTYLPDAPATVRPLVVIDPEDREQVERLVAILHDGEAWFGSGGVNQPTHTSLLQKALREFADPKPPKPEEPTGLGAVVEDAEGVLWVRLARNDSTNDDWKRSGYNGSEVDEAWERYVDIDVVRILSHGYDPEATS